MTTEVKEYLGYDVDDEMARFFWREEKLNKILSSLDNIKKDLDSLLEKDSCPMEPVSSDDIDGLFA